MTFILNRHQILGLMKIVREHKIFIAQVRTRDFSVTKHLLPIDTSATFRAVCIKICYLFGGGERFGIM